MLLLDRRFELVLAIFTIEAYMTFRAIFHKAFNLVISSMKSRSNIFLIPTCTKQWAYSILFNDTTEAFAECDAEYSTMFLTFWTTQNTQMSYTCTYFHLRVCIVFGMFKQVNKIRSECKTDKSFIHLSANIRTLLRFESRIVLFI